MRRLLLADGVLPVGRIAAGSQMPDAVLLDGEIITGVAGRERFLVEAPDAVVEHLPSGVLLPAFIDPHHHFLLGALSIASPPLPSRPGQPVAGLLAAIAGRVSFHGRGWVRLHSYDPRLLAERRPPTRAELEAICPDRPLVLISFSWHEAVLNSAGLAAMGWNETVRDTPTGRWIRDRRGRLTGEVRETPAYLAESASRTPLTTELRERWLAGAAQHGQNLLASGIVRVADAAVPPEFDQLYLDAVRAGGLPVTVHRRTSCAYAQAVMTRLAHSRYPHQLQECDTCDHLVSWGVPGEPAVRSDPGGMDDQDRLTYGAFVKATLALLQ